MRLAKSRRLAKHWYAKVDKTNTFGPYRAKTDLVPAELSDVLAECDTMYHTLHQHRLSA